MELLGRWIYLKHSHRQLPISRNNAEEGGGSWTIDYLPITSSKTSVESTSHPLVYFDNQLDPPRQVHSLLSTRKSLRSKLHFKSKLLRLVVSWLGICSKWNSQVEKTKNSLGVYSKLQGSCIAPLHSLIRSIVSYTLLFELFWPSLAPLVSLHT